MGKGAKDKIRVLTLVDVIAQAGGAERLAMELTMRLDPDRFERSLCVTRWDPDLPSTETGAATLARLAEAGVATIPIERRGKVAPGAWRRLYRHLREARVGVVHSHKFGSNVWGTAIGRFAGVPVVIAHEHSWAFEGSRLRRLVDREVIGRYADAVIAVSEADRRRMVEVEGIPAGKVRFIPNGMPPLSQVGPADDVRAELGLGPGPVIGAVGTLRPEKAFEVLIEAAALLLPRLPALQVLIAGDGDGEALRRRAAELGIEGSVHLLGLRVDVASVNAALDVAVNTSDREGSSLSIMEHMEAGLPVVATAVGGTPDLVSDGVTGLLVPPRDPQRLAAAIARLLEDTELARAMGERGRERRRERFDIDRMTQRVEALYDELLGAVR